MKNILFRYLTILILILIFLSEFITTILIKITLYFTYILIFFLNPHTLVNSIIINEYEFQIVGECLGISAYILLTLLLLSIPLKNIKENFTILFQSFLLYTLFNILRITIILIGVYFIGIEFYITTHLVFYEFLTSLGVLVIFIYLYKKKVKTKVIPFYTDIKSIINYKK